MSRETGTQMIPAIRVLEAPGYSHRHLTTQLERHWRSRKGEESQQCFAPDHSMYIDAVDTIEWNHQA